MAERKSSSRAAGPKVPSVERPKGPSPAPARHSAKQADPQAESTRPRRSDPEPLVRAGGYAIYDGRGWVPEKG